MVGEGVGGTVVGGILVCGMVVGAGVDGCVPVGPVGLMVSVGPVGTGVGGAGVDEAERNSWIDINVYFHI